MLPRRLIFFPSFYFRWNNDESFSTFASYQSGIPISPAVISRSRLMASVAVHFHGGGGVAPTTASSYRFHLLS